MQTIAVFIRNGPVKLFDDYEHHPNLMARVTGRYYDEEAVLKLSIVLREDPEE